MHKNQAPKSFALIVRDAALRATACALIGGMAYWAGIQWVDATDAHWFMNDPTIDTGTHLIVFTD